MNNNDADLREALARIAEIATAATRGSAHSHDDHGHDHGHDHGGLDVGCTIKSLPRRLWVEAAATAREANPVNAPAFQPFGGFAADVTDPLRIAVLTSKYWGPAPRKLTVSFMESTPADLRARIVSHLNAWAKTGCISFVETQGTGHVRISRAGGGYWSYLGTDILLIPKNRPTMNLEGFTMGTPESEFRRVVRHEAGHTLGFPHEHMRRDLVARIDAEKAIAHFARTQGWDEATVRQQVLTPLDERSIMGTPPDQTSIMCYMLPGSITRDGRPIRGGADINATDFAFAARIYPRADRGLRLARDEDWEEDEDVGEPASALAS